MVVCKSAFASLHGMSVRRIDSVLSRSKGITTLPIDKRGKHDSRPCRVSEMLLQQIDEHIRSFPAKPSHYSRSNNQDKKYLHEELSLAKMHRLYLESVKDPLASSLAGRGSPLDLTEIPRLQDSFTRTTHKDKEVQTKISNNNYTSDRYIL